MAKICLDIVITEIPKKRFASYTLTGIHQQIRGVLRKERTHQESQSSCVVDQANYQ